MKFALAIVAALSLSLPLVAQTQPTPIRKFPSPPAPAQPAVTWNMEELLKAPATYPATGIGELMEKDGIRPIFYDGEKMDGKPTRVFAWLGIPPVKDGEKLPAIVLVHGGGGTAFRYWVKMWMDRGYVAIALDTGGSMPITMEDGNRPKTQRHEYAGVPAASGGFLLSQKPLDQQWGYHAVSAIVRANSLLRSLPEVDPERIGLTGISWGGFLTELAAAVDDRFKFAAPVYGSGFLGENSFWLETNFQKMPPEMVERWIALWDPSQYVGRIDMPMLFCNGTNDKHFRPDCWQKTYQGVKAPVTLSLKVRMPHGHPPAGDPKEVTVFADSILRGGQPLAKITDRSLQDSVASIQWEAAVPVTKAELVYTLDSGPDWLKREWKTQPAELNGSTGAKVRIPDGATAVFMNIEDQRGCVVSCEHWDLSTH